MGVWIYGGPVTHHEQRLALELVCVVAAHAAAFDHFGRFVFLVSWYAGTVLLVDDSELVEIPSS